MSTNQQYDKSKQVRLSVKTHAKIKLIAAQKGETMTRILEQIIATSTSKDEQPIEPTNINENGHNSI